MSQVRPLARPLIRPLVRSLVLDTSGGGPTPPAPNDPLTDAYVAAITTAGAAPTPQQVTVLDTFFKAGWFTTYPQLLLWLPVWQAEAPNLVELRQNRTPTVTGTVTNDPEGVSGGGDVANYWSMGFGPTDIGVTPTEGALITIMPEENTSGTREVAIGAFNGGSTQTMHRLERSAGGTPGYTQFHQSNQLLDSSGYKAGVIIGSKSAGDLYLFKRNNADGFVEADRVPTDDGTPPPRWYFALARNDAGTATGPFQNHLGLIGFSSTGITPADAPQFTQDLADLYTGVTGISLDPPSPAPPPEPEPLPYDLNGHTAAELIAFIEADFPLPHAPGETAILQDLIDAERAGQNRPSLVTYLDALPGLL